MQPILQAREITRLYGEVRALSDASFELCAGEVHALMGENGAGKSTMSKILAGAIAASSGSVFIDGNAVTIESPRDAQALGIGIIYQELDLFPHCTIAENIVIGNMHYAEGAFTSRAAMEAFCAPFLKQVGLTCSARELIANLSMAQRQMVAIARALSMNARILIMDEPTSSLSEDAAETLFALIRSLRASGTAIVYVSHKMDEIFSLCDRITILRDGQTIGTREIATAEPGEIIQMIVGRSIDALARSVSHTSEEVVLAVAGLTTRRVSDISFDLHRGEVLGIAGLVGAGRTELGAALSGLDAVISGTITLSGQRFVPRSVSHANECGFALLPEDRKVDGLMMHMSVLENASLSILPRLQRAGFISSSRESATVMPTLQRLRARYHSAKQPVKTLSGGNQQKALLARSLAIEPSVLFLDDPARGIDIGAKQDIYSIIEELTAAGKSILLVSSELPELLRCCDRIMVMREGRVTGILSAAEASQEKIMTLATADMQRAS